jgi:ABC-type transporter Mla subunit MlaD
MSNDKVLSQEEIDAMLAQAGGSSPFASPSPARADPTSRQGQPRMPQPSTPQGFPPVQVPSGASGTQGLDSATQAMINNMAAKVQNLDAAMERVAQLERALYETNNAVRQIQQEFQANSGQIQLVSSRLEGVLANLKATLGYNAQKTFVCTNCRAKGEVAAEVKCTRCNKKNWWGWWPSKWR